MRHFSTVTYNLALHIENVSRIFLECGRNESNAHLNIP